MRSILNDIRAFSLVRTSILLKSETTTFSIIPTMASYDENNSNVEVKWKLCYQMKQYANNVF